MAPSAVPLDTVADWNDSGPNESVLARQTLVSPSLYSCCRRPVTRVLMRPAASLVIRCPRQVPPLATAAIVLAADAAASAVPSPAMLRRHGIRMNARPMLMSAEFVLGRHDVES